MGVYATGKAASNVACCALHFVNLLLQERASVHRGVSFALGTPAVCCTRTCRSPSTRSTRPTPCQPSRRRPSACRGDNARRTQQSQSHTDTGHAARPALSLQHRRSTGSARHAFQAAAARLAERNCTEERDPALQEKRAPPAQPGARRPVAAWKGTHSVTTQPVTASPCFTHASGFAFPDLQARKAAETDPQRLLTCL